MKKRLFAQKSLAELTLFFRKNTVMVIAFLAALVTMVLVPPDKAYASYFDYKTLACLFCAFAEDSDLSEEDQKDLLDFIDKF